MKNSTLLFLLPAILLCQFSFAQTIHRCGTDELAVQITKQFPETVVMGEQLETRYQNFVAHPPSFKTSNGTKYIIPVVVHVIHRTADVNVNDSSNISNADIYEQIEILNKAYRGQTSVHSSETDAQVEFRLAQKDPDGNCTTGIIRIANNQSINVNPDDTNPAVSIKRLSHWPSNRYLNIYVVNNIGTGVLGYSTFPWQTGTPRLDSLDGVVVGYRYFGYNMTPHYGLGNTTVHEVGHWLGLYHTFQPTCLDADCNAGFSCKNDTCTINGDRVCDTPPAGSPNFTQTPCALTVNSCHTDEDDTTYLNPFRAVALGGLGDQPDQIQNYMDYSDDVCMERFTLGQLTRISFYLASQRASVWQDANLIFTGSKGLLHDFDSLRSPSALNGIVRAMVEWPSAHRLIVAGDFTMADGIPVNGIASWDGEKWDSLRSVPAGMINQIFTLAVYKDWLYAGGSFNIAGQCVHIARYFGAFWSSVTSDTLFDGTTENVNTLLPYKGKLYAGGDFHYVDGGRIAANGVASWDGAHWDTLTSGLFGNSTACYAMTLWNNYLVVGGRFLKAGGFDCDKVALWNGTSWTSINTGANVNSVGRLNSLGSFGTKLYAGGDYVSVGGATAPGLSVYDGQFWGISNTIGTNSFAIEPFNGYLWVGGNIVDLASPITNVYLYDEPHDTALFVKPSYTGFDFPILCMTQYKDELYIGGEFNQLQGVNGAPPQTFNHICKVKTYCEQSPVGIIEEIRNRKSEIRLYPNPTSGKLIIENAEQEIGIFNLFGQEILRQKITGSNIEVEVSSLASGIYFVKSNNGVKKFLKQ